MQLLVRRDGDGHTFKLIRNTFIASDDQSGHLMTERFDNTEHAKDAFMKAMAIYTGNICTNIELPSADKCSLCNYLIQ